MLVDFLKDIFELLFRLVPFPVKPRLIKIGDPDRSSPVLVTTNYDLTVRRARKMLKDYPCYLLVAPAKGINVWCGAGGGHFTAASIVSIIKTSEVEDLVDHRRLIVPQLCANNMLIKDVREKAKWDAIFGPANVKDVPKFVSNNYKKTPDMNVVTFDLRERLEMGLAMAANFLFVLTIILLIFAKHILFPALIISFVLCMTITLGIFRIPGKTWLGKGMFLGFLSTGIFIIYALLFKNDSVASYMKSTLGIFALANAIGFDLPSWTPLWQCNLIGGIFSNVDLYVEKEKCIGCTLCWQVCPVGVFEINNEKSEAIHAEKCEACAACVKQCPTGAVISNMKVDSSNCACPTCKVIDTIQGRKAKDS